MHIAVGILAALFGLLHGLAGFFAQFKSKDPAVRGSGGLMALGGLFVFTDACSYLAGGAGWLNALAIGMGSLMVCFAAYLNGRRSGNFHLSHHIVRGGIAILLVAGFLLW